MNDRWKRGTLPFKTLFHLSRYHFRFPRYRRVKRRVIFDRLPSPSFSLTRTSRSHLDSLTYPKLQTSGRRDSWKRVPLPGKNVGHWSSSFINLSTVLTAIDTLNPRISVTDRDIEIIRKVASMAWFPCRVFYLKN